MIELPSLVGIDRGFIDINHLSSLVERLPRDIVSLEERIAHDRFWSSVYTRMPGDHLVELEPRVPLLSI